jgi:hypothetical protein
VHAVEVTLVEVSDQEVCERFRTASDHLGSARFVSPTGVTTTEEADGLIERVADSLSFDLQVRTGFTILPQRLENPDVTVRRQGIRRRTSLTFPKSRYPHAPVALYRAGVERSRSALIRYWALYQVLEYFFPTLGHYEVLYKLRVEAGVV